MSNRIIFELSQEDRDRADLLTGLLVELIDRLPKRTDVPTSDPLQEKLAAVVSNAKEPPTENTPEDATETAQDATEGANPAEDTPPEAEKPTTANLAPTEEEIAAQRAKLRSKFIELSAANKKEEAKAIVLEYAGSIPAVPADKLTECYEKLCALEG